MSQPERTNSVASQSSSSGWLGRSPCEPKSSVVLTSPSPKNICQCAIDGHAAVSGLAGSTSQRANPSRFLGRPAGSGGRQAGHAARDLLAGVIVLPADQDVRRPRRVHLRHHHHGRERRRRTARSRSSSARDRCEAVAEVGARPGSP